MSKSKSTHPLLDALNALAAEGSHYSMRVRCSSLQVGDSIVASESREGRVIKSEKIISIIPASLNACRKIHVKVAENGSASGCYDPCAFINIVRRWEEK